MGIPYILTDSSLTLVLDWVPQAIPNTHPNYAEILVALAANDDDQVRELVDIPATVARWSDGLISVVDRQLFFNGNALDTGLTRRILTLVETGNGTFAAPLCRFLERLMLNPSRRAVQGLYEWLVNSNLPIGEDGRFIAWKIVREDYMDVHSGLYDNSIGQKPTMARNEVDEDPERHCSYGLHFCSTSYISKFGGAGSRTMVVAVDPADVVAFPTDTTSKGRACTYEVIGEVPRAESFTHFDDKPPVYSYPPIVDDDTIESVNFDDGEIVVETYETIYTFNPYTVDELAAITMTSIRGVTAFDNEIWFDGEPPVSMTLARVIELDRE